MAYQIKGAITDLYNQLTEAEKAQIQAAGTNAPGDYQNKQETAQRAAEALFTQRSNVLMQQQQAFPAKMDAFLAANQNTGGQEVSLSPELQSGIGGDLSNMVVVNGKLVSKGS